MKTFILAATASTALLLSSGAAFATDGDHNASREEVIGFGSGALIGTAAAGPFGFIIGGAFGALIGDRMHQQDSEIDSLSTALDSSEDRVASLSTETNHLRSDNRELSGEVRRLKPLARPGLIEMLQAGIAMDLLFRTDEAVLSQQTDQRLRELGEMLAGMHDVRVQLDGFADERGDAAYNQRLSGQRVDFVRERLVAAGVPAARIATRAHGESEAIDDTVDSLALERRVTLKLYIDDGTSVAAVPSGSN